jgi:uncharacterized protein DUF3800
MTVHAGYVREALRLAFPSDVPPACRFVMNYTVYLDESGTHAGSKAVVVAGYMAVADAWIEFEPEWRSCLDEYGIGSFHMTDFANRTAPFNGWSEEARTNCYERLTSIISKYAWGGYCIVIPMDRYKRAVTPGARRILGGPYGLAAMRCFFEVADSLGEVDPAAVVAYVMDGGVKGRGQLLKAYDLNKSQSEWRILSLRFEDHRRFAPLQAADILAYEIYREYTRQVIGKGTMRFELRLLSGRPLIGGVMSEEEIASWSRVAETTSIWNPHMTPKRARELRRLFGP